MANADKSLDILIRTRAELAGAEEAAAALERAIGRAKALGRNTEELEQKHKLATEAIAAFKSANQDASATTEEGARKSRIFGDHMQEVKKGLQQLSREFPIAGYALRAFINPLSLAITLAIALFTMVKRHIAEMNAELDAQGELLATRVGDISAAMRSVRQDIAANAHTYAQEIQRQATAEDRFEQAVQASIRAIRARANAEVEVNDAEEVLELARADHEFRDDPVGRLARRLEINNRFARRRDELQTRGAEAEIAREEQAAQVRSQGQGPLDQAAREAFVAANDPRRRSLITDLPNQIKVLEQQLAAAIEAKIKAEEKVDGLARPGVGTRALRGFQRLFMPDSLYDREEDEKAKASADATAKSALAQVSERTLQTARERLQRLQLEDADAQFRSDEARRLARENAAALRAAQERINQLTATADADNSRRARLRPIREATREEQFQSGAATAEEQENDRLVREADQMLSEEYRRRARQQRAREQNRGGTGSPSGAGDSSFRGADVRGAADGIGDEVRAMEAIVIGAFGSLRQQVADARSRMDDSLNA